MNIPIFVKFHPGTPWPLLLQMWSRPGRHCRHDHRRIGSAGTRQLEISEAILVSHKIYHEQNYKWKFLTFALSCISTRAGKQIRSPMMSFQAPKFKMQIYISGANLRCFYTIKRRFDHPNRIKPSPYTPPSIYQYDQENLNKWRKLQFN